MKERVEGWLRRSPMKIGILAALLVVTAVACGSKGVDAGLDKLPKKEAASCLSDAQVGASRLLTTSDVDGRNGPEPVQYSGDSGPCSRIVFTKADGERHGVTIGGDLPVVSAFAVSVPGRKGQLVVVREASARGGYQERVIGFAGGRLEELTAAGQPVFDFIATDAPTTLESARCVAGGFVTVRAQGTGGGWNVRETTYALSGNHLTAGATSVVADRVSEKALRSGYPALVRGAYFQDCGGVRQ
jgi:hypothetical protein